jgi:uncharacterized membrane protein
MQLVFTIDAVVCAVAHFLPVHTCAVVAGKLAGRAIAAIALVVGTIVQTIAYLTLVDTLAIATTELTHTLWTVGCASELIAHIATIVVTVAFVRNWFAFLVV